MSFLVALPAAAAQRGGRYDSQIQGEVAQKLGKHDRFSKVRVSVEDGIVTLEGTAKVYRDKLEADRIAHHADHAQGVRNLITVPDAGISDAQLGEKVAEKLRYDRIDQGIMYNNFTLAVDHGVVTLNGEARTEVDRDSALSIVENTPGVRDVIDNVKVLPVNMGDDEIRIRVARAIYRDPALQRYAMDPQAPIRIVVERGHVTLYGIVDAGVDRQIAETRAREVSGTFSVVNKIMVAGQGPK